MLTRKRTDVTTPATPARETSSDTRTSISVYLDDPPLQARPDAEAFIFSGRGRPGLRIISVHASIAETSPAATEAERICDLEHPSQVMEVGVKLLDASYPDVDREKGPPLPRALCLLMEELGRLR